MKNVFILALILLPVCAIAQLVHPGDVVYINQGDTATSKRCVMPAFVTKTYPNSDIIDIVSWEGGGNDWQVPQMPHINIQQVYENGYGYVTKAEAIKYGLLDIHTYLPSVPDSLPIDFTKKLVNGKYEVQDINRQETYSGTTNGSGIYTVTFATAYPATPNIQATIIGGTTDHSLRVVSVSTTGFQVHVYELSDQDNVSGASVQVLITQQ